MWIRLCCIAFCFIAFGDACWPGTYKNWHAWSSCTHSCGGGTRTRVRYSCVQNKVQRQTEDCKTLCYNGGSYDAGSCHCPSWSYGRCCSEYDCLPGTYKNWHEWSSCTHPCGGGTRKRVRYSCVHNNEQWKTGNCNEFCYNDINYTGGSCHCQDWRYGRCCSAECPSIAHCVSRYCSNKDDVKCRKCNGDNYFYKRDSSYTRCERMCAWDNHHCWPGECSKANLKKYCHCSTGFYKVDTQGETSCQLNTSNIPSIHTCETRIKSYSGEMKQAETISTSAACDHLMDFYGNFQPFVLQYDLLAQFQVDIGNLSKPAFVQESHFGVTDTSLSITLQPIKGFERVLQHHGIQTDMNDGTSANEMTADKANLTLLHGARSLANGQWLCIYYEAKGGGYLKSIDIVSHVISAPMPYTKTTTTKRICYRYDSAPPEHCWVTGTCQYEPLQISKRITHYSQLPVRVEGWFDPIPEEGNSSHASGIETYEVTLHEVSASGEYLKVGGALTDQTKKISTSSDTIYLDLTSDIPKLYAIYVEVKDVADNVRQSRRFVLYDNSSHIDVNVNGTFYVESASHLAEYKWQTHHNDICLNWVNYFYNKHYFFTPLLNKIEPDPSGLIEGKYEQNTGDLPVSGTPNVYGIVSYKFSWALNLGTFVHEHDVQDFQDQRFCQRFALNDGETYSLRIRAIDIANNTLNDTRIVHIDRSTPHINNIWLEKDGVMSLFVHAGTDLSTMKLTFEALDPHSGMSEIKWALGTSDAGLELITGTLSVGTINATECVPPYTYGHNKCYCPVVGDCEMYKYEIPLNGLVEENKHQGDHNRNYVFTLKITNHAQLSNVEHLDILVDDSPPEEGVVLEGPIHGKDIDYTNDDSLILNWHGFIDHESGISLYRIALAERCLTSDEINNVTFTSDLPAFAEVPVTESSTRVSINFTGKMFTTIIAMNNAMASSIAVCSDGITRDISAPLARNITIKNAKWSESVLCHDSNTWLLNSKLQKIRLRSTSTCTSVCSNVSSNIRVATTLPTTATVKMDDEMSKFMCQTLPIYQDDVVTIYLPNDQIYLSWNVEEDESQMLDFYVGIGLQPSELSNPSLLSYTSTNQKLFFRKHHIGIGTSELFYLFLRMTNKAGLDSIYPIGPLLIDETPPVSDSKPTVHIAGEDIVVTWENDTFYDLDQREQINKIFFQFGHNGKPVSPLMEWRLESTPTCSGHITGCFKYPLRKLQQQDTDFGLDFYVSVIGYNNAGHFCKLDTETFQLPSKFPPGKAIVTDIDPHDQTVQSDVDVHFTESTLCAKWTGFRHHQKITLQFAVGTTPFIDDVIPFHKINNTNIYCISSAKLLAGVRYYVLIRSTCSGGQTLSTSNGATILTQAFINANLNVNIGRNCYMSKDTIPFHPTTQNGNVILKATGNFEVGNTYHIYNTNFTTISVKQSDGKLQSISGQDLYSLVPYIDQPTLYLMNISDIPDSLKVVRCPSVRFIQTNDLTVESYWLFQTGIMYPVDFEAALLESSNSVTGHTLVQYERTSHLMSTFLKYTMAKPGMLYQVAIRTCVQSHCLHPVRSDNISFVFNAPSGDISRAEIKSETGRSCFVVTLRWEGFKSESPVLFYQWSLSEDQTSSSPIMSWEKISDTTLLHFEVNQCISLPNELHKSQYACVRAFTEDGQSVTKCKELTVTSLEAYSTNVVYDINTNTAAWTNIKTIITSSNLGDMYRLLHGSELDFTVPYSSIAGVVLYGSERTIDWYLTTQRHIPHLCEAKLGCVTSVVTDTGYCDFTTANMKANTVYYICAKSNSTVIQRELFKETLESLHSCSDGFVINDSPPHEGKVSVAQHDGYLTDLARVHISWNGFDDNHGNAYELGYVSSIKSYSVSIGSRPGGEDLLEYTDVGSTTVKVVNISGADDGSTLFVSVKAINHAGLTTVVTTSGLLVDTSPPVAGDVLINQRGHVLHINTAKLSIRPLDFHDDVSGIESYDIQIGSKPHVGNMHSTNGLKDNIVEIDLPVDTLHDGHIYYLTMKAVNRAGLYSDAVIKSFIVDTSAPTGGQVMDGDPALMRDVNYQKDIHNIKSSWKGFDDIHSGLQFYRVGLGSQPFEDDVEPMVDIGLSTEMTWNLSFAPGKQYYTVVEACNKAALCTKRSSNGIILDNSAPIHGIVRVGSGSTHQSHVPRRSSLHIHWYGFEDPQSDIEHFEACLGSIPGQCDVVPLFNCFLQSNILKTGINLPRSTYLYATVTAYNKVGMHVSQSSDAFRVDDTPPTVVTLPKFVLDHFSIPGYFVQWEPSILRISWKFGDNESPIINHFVTLKTHHEGHTPLENLQLGSENNLTIALDERSRLNNGDTYKVSVTSCNAAGHCTTAASDDLLIDSTPPHLGGFMPSMTWSTCNDTSGKSTSNVSLTWYGFHDQESGIEVYYISVSRSYSGSELSNGSVEIKANASSENHQIIIKLSDQIWVNDVLILSIWAPNNAGLNSTVAKVSVNAMSATMSTTDSHGILELEKHSCDIHYCNQDCTCAVVGKPCATTNKPNDCTVLNQTDAETRNLPMVAVFSGIRGLSNTGQIVTASSSCLSGYWSLNNDTDLVKRFEWSMGMVNQPIGEGIFDLKNQIPWKDVGLQTDAVYCLSTNKSLIHGEKYIIYVRAWYKHNLNAIFTSNPITVDHTPPAVRRGKYVRDSDALCAIDFDYIDWVDTITACWIDVFSEQQSKVAYYTVALGTSPRADDVLLRTNVGRSMNLTLTSLKLSHGTKYYFSVTAYNIIGLHTSVSSDGFVVDMDKPIAGVVFNTGNHANAQYQSSNSSFTISWHGFIDHFSGIQSYYVGVTEESGLNITNSKHVNAGLLTRYTFYNLNLNTGVKLRGFVQAVDAAGHASDVSVSPAVTVDASPPHGYKCMAFVDRLNETTVCSHDNSYTMSTQADLNVSVVYKLYGMINKVSFSSTVEFKVGNRIIPLTANIQHDGSGQFGYTFLPQDSGRLHIQLSGICLSNTTISFTLSECSETTPSKVSAVSVHQLGLSTLQIKTMVLDKDSGIKRIYSGIGTSRGGFQIKGLSPIKQGSVDVIVADVPHGARLYATVIAVNRAGLRSVLYSKPAIMDKTPPVIIQAPDILVTEMTNTTQTVTVSWKLVDKESGIKQCYSNIDSRGIFEELAEFIATEATDEHQSYNVTLQHGDILVARVRCINWVELATETLSEPFYISRDPPSADNAVVAILETSKDTLHLSNSFPVVNHSRQRIAIQTNQSCVQMQWSGFRDLTGIEHFEYRLTHGRLPLTTWANAGKQTTATIGDVHLVSGYVYTTEVRAYNHGKHVSKIVSSDVLIIDSAPKLTGLPLHVSKSGDVLYIDWSNVFELEERVAYVYNLIIGSKRGYNDIVNDFYTMNTTDSIRVPDSTPVTPLVNEIFINVQCAYVTGLSNTYTTSYKLA